MTVPTPATMLAGEFIDAADWNAQIRDIEAFLLNPPSCSVYKGGVGALADSTWDEINFDQELFDWSTTGMHSSTTNNSRVSAPEPGRYTVKAGIEYAANATGSRRLNVRKNAGGVQTAGDSLKFKVVNAVTGAGNETTVDVSFDAVLAAGDYIEVFGHQTSGAPLNVDGGAAATYLSLTWRARQ